jgi:hypothetical protein
LKWSQRSRHTTGTAKGNGLYVQFNQPATALEHELQQILGAQTSPIYHSKYISLAFVACFDSDFLCDFNTTSPQMQQTLLGLFWQERDMLHTRKLFFKHTEKVVTFLLVQHSR